MELGPTRTDLNLGTPRFEIPSHSLTTDHRLCDFTIHIKLINTKLPSKHNNLHRASQLWCSTQSTWIFS